MWAGSGFAAVPATLNNPRWRLACWGQQWLVGGRMVFSVFHTRGGAVIIPREVQSEKAPFPMLVTEVGITTEAREVQPWKTSFSMLVTDVGIMMEVRELQRKKAPPPMS